MLSNAGKAPPTNVALSLRIGRFRIIQYKNGKAFPARPTKANPGQHELELPPS